MPLILLFTLELDEFPSTHASLPTDEVMLDCSTSVDIANETAPKVRMRGVEEVGLLREFLGLLADF